jgi:pimeloyl-ACP methyl ester carboxylesterase
MSVLRRQPRALVIGLCVAAMFVAAAIAHARPAQHTTEPRVLHSPAGVTEVGFLEGASYRIDVPNDWNGSLVLFYHGYAEQPVTFPIAEKLSSRELPLLQRHYAIAQSAYSQTGWALAQAYPETEELRRYFIQKFGQPHETYIAGMSMGGVLVSITLELNPKPYRGGLDLCGSVGPSYVNFEHRFALRAAFDYYFPGILPTLVPVPANFEATPAVRERVRSALHANPAAATAMRNLTGVRTDADLAWDMAYFTFVIGDLQHRSGGNPFENRDTIYSGTGPTTATDAVLNEKVRRYSATPGARIYLYRHYSPNGRLGKPMLALHTLYDPVVPPSSLTLYAQLVHGAGAGDNLVQQYVPHDGHCNITGDEVGKAFDQLVHWTHGGPLPAPGLLR